MHDTLTYFCAKYDLSLYHTLFIIIFLILLRVINLINLNNIKTNYFFRNKNHTYPLYPQVFLCKI